MRIIKYNNNIRYVPGMFDAPVYFEPTFV